MEAHRRHRSLLRLADRPRHEHGRRRGGSIWRSTGSTSGLQGRVRVYKGVEANILADGSLDLQDGRAARLRIRDRVAALAAAQGRRIRPRACSPRCDQPGRGDSRPSAGADVQRPAWGAADWDECSRKRRRARGDRDRRQLAPPGHRLRARRRAMEEGCIFALDSDAHSIAEFPFTDYAIAHARLARFRLTGSSIAGMPGSSMRGWTPNGRGQHTKSKGQKARKENVKGRGERAVSRCDGGSLSAAA